MTNRERNLSIGVGAVVALAIGWQAVQWTIVRPFGEVHAQLAEKKATLLNLEKRHAQELNNKFEWKQRVGRTLHGDANEAQLLLRKDVESLLAAHGLTGKETSISSPTVTVNRKNRFTEVAFLVNTRGTLEEITAFLKDFYRRPYLSQIRQISLNAGESRPTGKARGAKEELGISMKIETLVLPTIPEAPATAMGTLEEATNREAEGRLAAADASEYDRVTKLNVFRWPAEPKPVVKQVDPPPPTQVAVAPPEDKPKKRAAPPDDKHVVCGATSNEGEFVVWVRDDSRRDEPPKQYRMNETMDNGRVALIHPLGVVVKQTEEGAGEREYFYALGKSFKDRQPLDPVEHPEVWEEYLRMHGEQQ